MDLEYKTFPRKIKSIAKGLEIYGFGIFEYSVRSESRHMIALWDQSYYVPGLPKDLCIIYPQGICTSEGYTGIFIARFHDEHDGYAELSLNDYKPGWQKAKPVNRVYFNDDSKSNLPNPRTTLSNQRDKEVNALASAIYVTN